VCVQPNEKENEMKTYAINRTFELTEEQARKDAYYAAGRAIGIIVHYGGCPKDGVNWPITRITIEPGPESPVWFSEWAGRNDYDFFMGRLARARASGDSKHFADHREEAMKYEEGRHALEDLLLLWPVITAVADTLLEAGALDAVHLSSLLPAWFDHSARQLFDARAERWFAA
jgi:hypothetical protein